MDHRVACRIRHCQMRHGVPDLTEWLTMTLGKITVGSKDLIERDIREEVRVNLMLFISLEHVLLPRTQNVN